MKSSAIFRPLCAALCALLVSPAIAPAQTNIPGTQIPRTQVPRTAQRSSTPGSTPLALLNAANNSSTARQPLVESNIVQSNVPGSLDLTGEAVYAVTLFRFPTMFEGTFSFTASDSGSDESSAAATGDFAAELDGELLTGSFVAFNLGSFDVWIANASFLPDDETEALALLLSSGQDVQSAARNRTNRELISGQVDGQSGGAGTLFALGLKSSELIIGRASLASDFGLFPFFRCQFGLFGRAVVTEPEPVDGVGLLPEGTPPVIDRFSSPFGP